MHYILLITTLFIISCGRHELIELKKSEKQNLDAVTIDKQKSILLQGFDRLSNETKLKCLKQDNLEIQVLEVNEGASDVAVYESLGELANSLKLGLGISGGGGWAFAECSSWLR